MRILVGLLILFPFLSGCWAMKNPGSAESVTASCDRRHDKFTNATAYFGPDYRPSPYARFYLATGKPDSDTHRLMISVAFEGWAFLEECYMIGGTKLTTRVLDREATSQIDGVYGVERLAVEIPRKYLVACDVGNGMALKLTGRRRNYEVTIPPHYVAGWLSYLESQKSGS